MRLVIIGNGIAGNQVAFDVRTKDPEADIVILSAEDVPEYDPCSLPYFWEESVSKPMCSEKKPKIMKPTASNFGMTPGPCPSIRTKNGLPFIPENRSAMTNWCWPMAETCSSPPIPGIDQSGVFSCKQLSETRKLAAHHGTSAVVIGSGAIGIEAAEALKRKGVDVYVIELMDWILPSLFDEPTAKRLETELTGYGIQVFTHEKVMEIKGDGNVTGVVTDRRTLDCDTVVVATGVVPGTALARTAGIETGRGIQVNRQMQTSDPDIYACGDCVETIDACTGEIAMFQLKHNAIEQAQVAARHILGEPVRYLGAYAFARAHFFDTHAATFGKTQRALDCMLGDKRIVEREDQSNYLRVVMLDNKVVGARPSAHLPMNWGCSSAPCGARMIFWTLPPK